MTHRIWSSVVFRPALMAGIATLTIVVSSMIMKNPVVRTSSTNHGLVRACAMFPPQHFISGATAGPPLQLSVRDLLRDLVDPRPLGLEDRDLVLELDHREPGVIGLYLIESL